MEAQTETTTGPPRRLSVLQGFVPLVEVYSGATPMFESEGAARWFIRSRRQVLVRCCALAIERGRALVHPDRLAMVIEQDAFRAAENMYGGD